MNLVLLPSRNASILVVLRSALHFTWSGGCVAGLVQDERNVFVVRVKIYSPLPRSTVTRFTFKNADSWNPKKSAFCVTFVSYKNERALIFPQTVFGSFSRHPFIIFQLPSLGQKPAQQYWHLASRNGVSSSHPLISDSRIHFPLESFSNSNVNRKTRGRQEASGALCRLQPWHRTLALSTGRRDARKSSLRCRWSLKSLNNAGAESRDVWLSISS